MARKTETCPRCGNIVEGRKVKSYTNKVTRQGVKAAVHMGTTVGGMAKGAAVGSAFGPIGTIVGGAAGLVGSAMFNQKINETIDKVGDKVEDVALNMEYEFDCPNCGQTWSSTDNENDGNSSNEDELQFSIDKVREENGYSVVEGSLDRGSICTDYEVDIVKHSGERIRATIAKIATKEMNVDSVSSFVKVFSGDREYKYEYTSYMSYDDEGAYDVALYLTGIDADDISFEDKIEEPIDDEEEYEPLEEQHPLFYSYLLNYLRENLGKNVNADTSVYRYERDCEITINRLINEFSAKGCCIGDNIRRKWERRNSEYGFEVNNLKDVANLLLDGIIYAPEYEKDKIKELYFWETYIFPFCERMDVKPTTSLRSAKPRFGKIWSNLMQSGYSLTRDDKDTLKMLADYDKTDSTILDWSWHVKYTIEHNSDIKYPDEIFDGIEKNKSVLNKLVYELCGEYIFGEPLVATNDISSSEQDYLNELKEILADGEISARERRLLDKIRVQLGISEARAKELEDFLCPKLTLEEQEYLDEYKEIIAEGEISARDQRFLEKLKKANGISDVRAKEIEALT